MIFKTYNKDGLVLLDTTKPVFSYLGEFKPKRLLEKEFKDNKREMWYRAKRLGINSKMRQRWVDIHTPEYCMYYIDIPNAISPIAFTATNFNIKDSKSFVFLNTGFFDNKTRMVFYSNGRLSNEQLEKTYIQVYDTKIQKEDKVGVNLYDKQGNITFSSKNRPLDINLKTIHIDGSDTGLISDIEFMNSFKECQNRFQAAKNSEGWLQQQHMGASQHIWDNHIKPKLIKRPINLQDVLDKAFSKSGFTKEGGKYVGKVANNLLIMGNLEVAYHALTTNKDKNYIEQRKLLLSVMSHGNTIVIQPTIKFSEINTDSSVKSIDINTAEIKNFHVFDEYILKINEQDLVIQYTKNAHY